jgi:hypothetical protein
MTTINKQFTVSDSIIIPENVNLIHVIMIGAGGGGAGYGYIGTSGGGGAGCKVTSDIINCANKKLTLIVGKGGKSGWTDNMTAKAGDGGEASVIKMNDEIVLVAGGGGGGGIFNNGKDSCLIQSISGDLLPKENPQGNGKSNLCSFKDDNSTGGTGSPDFIAGIGGNDSNMKKNCCGCGGGGSGYKGGDSGSYIPDYGCDGGKAGSSYAGISRYTKNTVFISAKNGTPARTNERNQQISPNGGNGSIYINYIIPLPVTTRILDEIVIPQDQETTIDDVSITNNDVIPTTSNIIPKVTTSSSKQSNIPLKTIIITSIVIICILIIILVFVIYYFYNNDSNESDSDNL